MLQNILEYCACGPAGFTLSRFGLHNTRWELAIVVLSVLQNLTSQYIYEQIGLILFVLCLHYCYVLF